MVFRDQGEESLHSRGKKERREREGKRERDRERSSSVSVLQIVMKPNLLNQTAFENIIYLHLDDI